MARLLKRLHRDEAGMEAVQVVLIVAIAAVVLLVVKSLWDGSIKTWFSDNVTNVTKWAN
jgi:Flp pilus assembly pilin Flp